MSRRRIFKILPMFALTAACGCLCGTSCGHAADQSHPPSAGESGAPAKVTYTCPMHADVVANSPGNCPKCGMALVVKK